ncbi:CbtA family protein [Actinomycetospora termitidis]|uniref:CbtA family protein n=1 Tax=Actinomycetospora termitidis TaxID=3053470 RepID=A0ABT7MCR1_9PSEU|nr:CbtA family protein [Actinomycetospora sp. Odt1-22]MDL5158466.1 CbtA family protein [Actinomycetospora sp. Odt1-22]
MHAKAVVPRAALAGAVGGVVAWLFALVFAEPLIQAAIDYEGERGEAEAALDAAAGIAPPEEGPEIFSRTVQGVWGIGVGMIVAGVALGLLFAVVYTLLQGKVSVRPRVLALLVAGAGFLTFYATPFVKYPANPPAVGHDETIGDRSGLFLVMVVGSIVFLVAAVFVVRALRERLGLWNAVLVGGVAYIVLSGILMAVLPSLGELAANVATYGPADSETPQPLRDPAGTIVFPGFDPDLLYSFRVYAITAQAIVWGLLGLVFGALAERATGSASVETRESVQA